MGCKVGSAVGVPSQNSTPNVRTQPSGTVGVDVTPLEGLVVGAGDGAVVKAAVGLLEGNEVGSDVGCLVG